LADRELRRVAERTWREFLSAAAGLRKSTAPKRRGLSP
jgi:hypothetical protein